jgi:hypothetical protein
MAATMLCNYNQTHGFLQRCQGPQSVFMNCRVHHHMRVASSTSQNCGISYIIFDVIASLAGSADTQNVDPGIPPNICKGLRNENSYCVDLCFLGVEARQRAEGINVVPRMKDHIQHFVMCSVVNNRQTSTMTLQVKMHTNSVSDINMDSEKMERLCFPLLSPHGEPGCTNLSKSHLSPDEFVMTMMLRPKKYMVKLHSISMHRYSYRRTICTY